MNNLSKLFFGLGLILLISCGKEENIGPQTDQNQLAGTPSTEVSQQLELNQHLDDVRALGLGGPGAVVRQSPETPFGRSTNNPSWSNMRVLMGEEEPDDICVIQSFVVKDDGSFVWAIDFGDGCEIDGEFWKGKVIETYHVDEEAQTFTEAIKFENFGQEDWMINGGAALEGTYVGDEEDSTFSVEYGFVRDLLVTEGEEKWSVEQIGRESLDETAWRVLEMAANVTYENEAGAEANYQNAVGEPLVFLFACEEEGVHTYVDGMEYVKYSNNEGFVEALINYGDGECDNIVIIVENSERFEVDLGEEDPVS